MSAGLHKHEEKSLMGKMSLGVGGHWSTSGRYRSESWDELYGNLKFRFDLW